MSSRSLRLAAPLCCMTIYNARACVCMLQDLGLSLEISWSRSLLSLSLGWWVLVFSFYPWLPIFVSPITKPAWLRSRFLYTLMIIACIALFDTPWYRRSSVQVDVSSSGGMIICEPDWIAAWDTSVAHWMFVSFNFRVHCMHGLVLEKPCVKVICNLQGLYGKIKCVCRLVCIGESLSKNVLNEDIIDWNKWTFASGMFAEKKKNKTHRVWANRLFVVGWVTSLILHQCCRVSCTTGY